MEEKNDQVHSSLESSEQEYYAFILGKSLRIDDNHEQVLKIYDSIPRAYSQSQFDGIKERARVISELASDDFNHLKSRLELAEVNDCSLSLLSMTQDPQVEPEFLEVGDVDMQKQCISSPFSSGESVGTNQSPTATVSDILDNNSESFTVCPHTSLANTGAILDKKMQSQQPDQLRKDSQSSGVYESCDESKDITLASHASTKPRKKKKKTKTKKQGNGYVNSGSANGSEDSNSMLTPGNAPETAAHSLTTPSISNGERKQNKSNSTKSNSRFSNNEISVSPSSVNSVGGGSGSADPVSSSPSYFNISPSLTPSVDTRGSSSSSENNKNSTYLNHQLNASSQLLSRLSPSGDSNGLALPSDHEICREEFQEVRQRRSKYGKNTANNSPLSSEIINGPKQKSNSATGFNNPRNGIISHGQSSIAPMKQSYGAKTTEVNGQSYANRLKSIPNPQTNPVSCPYNGVQPNATNSNVNKSKQPAIERIPRSVHQSSATAVAANNSKNCGKLMSGKNATQPGTTHQIFQKGSEEKQPRDSVSSKQKDAAIRNESNKGTDKVELAALTESIQVVDMPVCLETNDNCAGKQNAQLCFQYENSVNKGRCASTSSVSPSLSISSNNTVEMCNKASSLNHANIATTAITNSNEDPTALQVPSSSTKMTSFVTINTAPSSNSSTSRVSVPVNPNHIGPATLSSPLNSTSQKTVVPEFTGTLNNAKQLSHEAFFKGGGGSLGQLKFGDFDINTINGAAVGDFNLFEATAFLAKTWETFANRSDTDREWCKCNDVLSMNASDSAETESNESRASGSNTLSANSDKSSASAPCS